MDAAHNAIVDVSIRYATGIDHRRWDLYRSCFADECVFDFSSWSGRPAARMTADDWVAKVRRTNGGFDATQHLMSNHWVTDLPSDEVSGEVTCVNEVQAQHWFSGASMAAAGHPEQPARCTLGGHYTNRYRRAAHGSWVIVSCQLTVRWVTGDPSIFDLARTRGARLDDA